MKRANRFVLASLVVTAGILVCAAPLQARISKIVIDEKISPATKSAACRWCCSMRRSALTSDGTSPPAARVHSTRIRSAAMPAA